MELIKAYGSCCLHCELNVDVVDIENNDINGYVCNAFVCEKCLVEALLIIKPVDFDKEEIAFVLEMIVNERLHVGGKLKPEFQKFVEWIKPFIIDSEGV